jgi:hypothetical protein
MRRRLPRILAVLVLVALPAGCGGDEDGSADSDTSTTTAAPTATATVPQAPPSERDRLSSCLTKEGYRLQGGLTQSSDSDAADYQILFSGPRGGGYIGFYENASRARRVATQLRKNAQRTSGASVERHGSINIVFVDMADPAARERVRGCLVM